MKKSIIILTAIAIFLVSLLYIAPVAYKGYPPSAVYESLNLARNLALHNVAKTESGKNVYLSSSRIKDDGIFGSPDNILTPIAHSWIYQIFGLNLNLPLYASVLFFALSNIILFFLVLKLFDYWPAVIFSLFDIFMPVIWHGAIMPGFYEFAIFFFSLALLIYFSNKNYLSLFGSGVFLGLAVLSRNAFFISALALLLYDFWRTKSWKRLFIFLLPLIMIVGGFAFASALKGGSVSDYLSKKSESYTTYSHLFPDAYTYYFERENFLQNLQREKTIEPDLAQAMLQFGGKISLINYLWIYLKSAGFYAEKLFATVIFGGPFFVFLMIIGAVYLFKNYRDLFNYFILIWLPLWYVALVILKTNNWDHFLEIRWPLVLMLALAVYWLIKIVGQLFANKNLYYIFSAGLILFIGFQIFSASRWMFHEFYETSLLAKYPDLIARIEQASLSNQDVIAVGAHQTAPELLNYYTDKNFVYFSNDSIQKLINNRGLIDAFKFFGVTQAIGFKPEISQKIFEQINIKSL